MDEKKFKVYCTFKFNWDISAFENIDLKVNPGNSLPREDLLRDIKGCHGLICNPRSCKIDAEALDAAGEQLIVISTPSTGYDHIDVEECTRRNILVGYLSHTFTDSVAEYTIGLILNMSRRITEAANLAKTVEWSKILLEKLATGKSLRGSTFGIFGLGSIGMSIASKLSVFGVKRIIYNNRKENQDAIRLNYEFVDFDQLLNESDFIVCAASLNKENENKFDLDAFKKMKKTCIFINIARGGLVNHQDLFEALNSRLIFSAAIDATAPEPLPIGNPLYNLPNCLVLPHIAWDDETSRTELYRLCLLNLLNGLNNKPLIYQIKK